MIIVSKLSKNKENKKTKKVKKVQRAILLGSLLVSSVLLYSADESFAGERSEPAYESESNYAAAQHIWSKRGWKLITEEYTVKNPAGESVLYIASKFMYKNTYPDKNGMNREIKEFASGIVELNYGAEVRDIYSVVPYGTVLKVNYWIRG